MAMRYGSGNSYIEIEDDGSITAAGEGDFAPGQVAFFPRTNPPPAEGSGVYEIWRAHEETPEEDDKPIQLVDKSSGMQYLFIFRADCSIDFYYLGENFHTGTVTYLFLFQVPSQPSGEAVKWSIYAWIMALGG